MQRVSHTYGHDLVPFTAAGVELDNAGANPNQSGYTLVAGTTYYYPLGRGVKEAPYISASVKWDASAILTITVEDTNFTDVSNTSTTAGDWEKENPSTAYVAADGNATVTAATVVVPGGTAGGCCYNLGFIGSLRARLKIVVGGTGGVVRVAQNMKD
jgi:hypothetical protein